MMDRSCFMFGHSDCPKEAVERIAGVIRKLYTEDGIDNFIVGSRGGFDRCARQALMMVKDSGANIKVMLLIAYHPSERGFVLPEGEMRNFQYCG